MARLKTLGSRVAAQGDRLKAVSSDSWRATKHTAAQRGYGYKWQQARAGHLKSHPWCVMCLDEMGLDRDLTMDDAELVCGRAIELVRAPPFANVVDHRVPHRGDMTVFWDRSLWDSLCTHHHSSEKQRIDAALRSG